MALAMEAGDIVTDGNNKYEIRGIPMPLSPPWDSGAWHGSPTPAISWRRCLREDKLL